MEAQINERFVKLSSRIPFPKDIALGDDVTVVIAGHNYIANCVKREELDQQDGTKDVVHVLKFVAE